MKPIAIAVIALGLAAGSASAQQSEVVVVNPPEDPANVVPVADTLPFLRNVLVFVPSGSFRAEVQVVLSVPTGFNVTLSNLSAYVTTDAGQRAAVTCRIPNPILNGNGDDYFFPIPIAPQMTHINNQGVAQTQFHAGVASIHLALEPTSTFLCEVRRSRSVETATGHITLTGHLVPVAADRRL